MKRQIQEALDMKGAIRGNLNEDYRSVPSREKNVTGGTAKAPQRGRELTDFDGMAGHVQGTDYMEFGRDAWKSEEDFIEYVDGLKSDDERKQVLEEYYGGEPYHYESPSGKSISNEQQLRHDRIADALGEADRRYGIQSWSPKGFEDRSYTKALSASNHSRGGKESGRK